MKDEGFNEVEQDTVINTRLTSGLVIALKALSDGGECLRRLKEEKAEIKPYRAFGTVCPENITGAENKEVNKDDL